MSNSNDSYSGSYHDVSVHRMMLHDVVRTEAYERALRRAVRSGCRVLDFGCGSGVLSIFASRFGAEKVYAVDQSIFIQKAYAIAACNKIDNIVFCHNDHMDLELDAKVDILVSEWLGHFVFSESMLGPLLHVRDKFLVEGGMMIPESVSLYAGLVTDDYFYEDLSFLQRRPYGIDFSPIADAPLCQTSLEILAPNQILESVADLGTLDMNSLATPPKELVGTVVPDRAAIVYGVCGWFDAQLVPEIRIGTGPGDPPSHWNQVYFPLCQPFQVTPGTELTIRIAPPDDDSRHEACWSWSLSDGDRTIEMNDLDPREELDPFLKRGVVTP